MITLGLSVIEVGEASSAGIMPASMTKIGKTYQDTCKITQDASDVTEHFEEGMAAPEVRIKTKKIPKLTFSLMDMDAAALAKYVGGAESAGEWSFDGNEIVSNVAIRVKPKQGLTFDIPNADIEAVIDAEMSAKGIFLVNFTVTPLAVDAGKAIRAKKLD